MKNFDSIIAALSAFRTTAQLESDAQSAARQCEIPIWQFWRLHKLTDDFLFEPDRHLAEALRISALDKPEYQRHLNDRGWLKSDPAAVPTFNQPSCEPTVMTGKFINSDRFNPCPVCGRTHDDGCAWSDDGKTVLCRSKAHDGQVPQPPDEINGWKFSGKTTGNGVLERAIYIVADWQKPASAGQSREQVFEYPDINGAPCVRTKRVDKADGKKLIWQEYWIEDSELSQFVTSSYWVKMGRGKGTQQQRKLYEQRQKELAAMVHLFRIDEALALHQQTGRPLMIVEGETSCLALLQQGIPATTSIGGAGKFEQYGWPNYLKDLEPFGQVVICPDCDEDGRKHAETIAKHRPDSRWLYANPAHARWRQQVWKSGYDVKNWIEEGATAEQILAAVEDKRIAVSADSVAAEIQPVGTSVETDEDLEPDENDSKPRADYKRIKRFMGDRIRYNEMRGVVEVDGKTVDLDSVRLDLMIDHKLLLRSGADEIAGIVLKIAKERSFHPVEDYLDSVYRKYQHTSIDALQQFADRYFGQSDPIYTIFAIRFLVAAVARIYEPGTKHDTALILQGKQGWGKSTFFKKLAGDQWFDDSLANTSDKDEKLKLNQTWFMEWAELETVFKRKDVSQTKAFLSSASDKVRPPYARSVVDMPRRSVIVGSTNQDEFLNDSTGNRRFWIIPLAKRIPIGELLEERDRIWAAAVHLYKVGVHWHLWKLEEAAANQISEQYQSTDTWEGYIADYVKGANQVSITALLENALELEKSRHDKAAQMRAADILRSMGWKSTRRRVDGILTRVWLKPDKPKDAVTAPQEAGTGSDTSQTLVNSPLFQLCTTVTTSKEDLINIGRLDKRNRVIDSDDDQLNSENFSENLSVEDVSSRSQQPESRQSEVLGCTEGSNLDGTGPVQQIDLLEPKHASKPVLAQVADSVPTPSAPVTVGSSVYLPSRGEWGRVDKIEPDGCLRVIWSGGYDAVWPYRIPSSPPIASGRK